MHDLTEIPTWFVADDAGRSQSVRPKQRNDCVVRAFAIAYARPYDEVYDRFARMGRKPGAGTDNNAWRALLRLEGWKPVGWPSAKRGEEQMHPDRFCAEYPEGRFLIREAKHLVAVIDGRYHDVDPPRADRCVYGAFRMPLELVGKPIQA